MKRSHSCSSGSITVIHRNDSERVDEQGASLSAVVRGNEGFLCLTSCPRYSELIPLAWSVG